LPSEPVARQLLKPNEATSQLCCRNSFFSPLNLALKKMKKLPNEKQRAV